MLIYPPANQNIAFMSRIKMVEKPDAVLNDFRRTLSSLNVKSETIQKVDKAYLGKWHKAYSGLLTLHSNLTPEHQKNMTQLVESTIEGKGRKILFDRGTEVGKANIATRNEFVKEGLNYYQWLNYKGKTNFNHAGVDCEISLWKRKPEQDFFIGSNTGTCIAPTDKNGEAMYGALVNTRAQYVQIKNKQTGKVRGYARVYLMKDQNNKKLLFVDSVADRITISDDLIKNLFKFLQGYSKAVNPKSNKILYTYEFGTKNKKTRENTTLETIGKLVSDTKTSARYIEEIDHSKKTKDFWAYKF